MKGFCAAFPESIDLAVQQYLRFAIEVISETGVSFPPGAANPVPVAELYVEGNIDEGQYRSAADEWWGYIEKNEEPIPLTAS